MADDALCECRRHMAASIPLLAGGDAGLVALLLHDAEALAAACRATLQHCAPTTCWLFALPAEALQHVLASLRACNLSALECACTYLQRAVHARSAEVLRGASNMKQPLLAQLVPHSKISVTYQLRWLEDATATGRALKKGGPINATRLQPHSANGAGSFAVAAFLQSGMGRPATTPPTTANPPTAIPPPAPRQLAKTRSESVAAVCSAIKDGLTEQPLTDGVLDWLLAELGGAFMMRGFRWELLPPDQATLEATIGSCIDESVSPTLGHRRSTFLANMPRLQRCFALLVRLPTPSSRAATILRLRRFSILAAAMCERGARSEAIKVYRHLVNAARTAAAHYDTILSDPHHLYRWLEAFEEALDEEMCEEKQAVLREQHTIWLTHVYPLEQRITVPWHTLRTAGH